MTWHLYIALKLTLIPKECDVMSIVCRTDPLIIYEFILNLFEICFSVSLKKCSVCKSMYYCDQKCQRNDWKECHKNECKLYSNYYKQYLFRDCDRFLLRLWLLSTHSTQKLTQNYELYNKKNRCFHDLMTHYNQIRDDIKRINYFEMICKRFNSCDIDFDYEQLFVLFCKLCINSFSILNEDLNEVGTALYISASVFNHSCQPNAGPVFDGIDLQIRALKDIDSNEEIFINYIDLKMNRTDRQLKLYEQYYFSCNCVKCETLSDYDIDYELLKHLDKQLDDMINNEGDWCQSFSIGMQSIPLYNQIYGDFHPDFTVQLMRVLKLKVLISHNLDEKNTIQLIKKTQNCIKITHGFEHSLYKIFREVIG